MLNEIEVIKINRTAFVGPKSVKRGKQIIKKIESIKGVWLVELTNNKQTVELLLVEDGKIAKATSKEILQEATIKAKEFRDHFVSLEVS